MPDDPVFISAVSGALLELTREYNWEQSGTLTPKEQSDAFDDVYMSFVESVCTEPQTVEYPNHAHLFPHDAVSLNAGTVAITILAGQQFGLYGDITPVVNANGMKWEIPLRRGRYNISYVGVTQAANGNIDVIFDDVVIHNTIRYSAAQVLNSKVTLGEVVDVETDGVHVIQLKVNGKHASSTGYGMKISCLDVLWFTDLV